MNKYVERIYNGIIKENPTFVIMLGMCPTLATTTSAINAIGMGLSTTAVLVFSNLLISALRHVIPDRMRLPGEIVVVASLVTIVQMLIQAYVPSIYNALGIYIPLIVVNCIILGRAEAYALFNPPLLSFCDGLGMGLGFTFALTVLGSVRELLGAGSIFGIQLIPEAYHISIMVLAPGAFLVLAMLTAIQNKLKLPSATNGDAENPEFVCSGNCMGCFAESEEKAQAPVKKEA
jgi:electron transport complex protein RnfE